MFAWNIQAIGRFSVRLPPRWSTGPVSATLLAEETAQIGSGRVAKGGRYAVQNFFPRARSSAG